MVVEANDDDIGAQSGEVAQPRRERVRGPGCRAERRRPREEQARKVRAPARHRPRQGAHLAHELLPRGPREDREAPFEPAAHVSFAGQLGAKARRDGQAAFGVDRVVVLAREQAVRVPHFGPLWATWPPMIRAAQGASIPLSQLSEGNFRAARADDAVADQLAGDDPEQGVAAGHAEGDGSARSRGARARSRASVGG